MSSSPTLVYQLLQWVERICLAILSPSPPYCLERLKHISYVSLLTAPPFLLLGCTLVVLMLLWLCAVKSTVLGKRIVMASGPAPSESFHYMFSASAPILALETTHLDYMPPRPLGGGLDPQPLILQQFDRLHECISYRRIGSDVQTDLSPTRLGPPGSRHPTPGSPGSPHTTGNHEQVNPAVASPAHSFRTIRFVTPIPSMHTLPASATVSREAAVDANMSGSPIPEPTETIVTRHFRAFKSSGSVKLESKERGTTWFETESSSRITHPPHFANSTSVQHGDVYCHRTPDHCQLWLWVSGGGDRPTGWIPVAAGYRRQDGRRLVVTDSYRIPSWVSEATYNAKFKHRLRA
ncbi:hypothetical protein C8Q73DRAFT_529963 [Cubamyces lactineus]|nr:hypothetical protein C8Q73DRAFT_529963 [Cubamyces lactineus]